jgi:hypothetical protein
LEVKMMSTEKAKISLAKILEMLVEECGFYEVQQTLSGISRTKFSPARQKIPRGKRERRRPTAEEVVQKQIASDGEREIILVIAGKFDRKEFLPSIGDIREFLATRGGRPGGVKDRADGFRRVLSFLSQMSHDKLKELADSSRYAGPAQVGPLSDAIRSTGDAIRRSEGIPETKSES